MFVIFKGKKYYVHSGILALINVGIKDIDELKGLSELKYLKVLNLSHNDITEIKGLETLVNLQALYLNYNLISEIKGLDNLTKLTILNLRNNSISEVKGLENLINLRKLNLKKNLIPRRILLRCGGIRSLGNANLPHLFVNYCARFKKRDEDLKMQRIKTIEEIKRDNRLKEAEKTMKRMENLLKVGIELTNKEEYRIGFNYFKAAMKISFDLLKTLQSDIDIDDIKKQINSLYLNGIKAVIKQGIRLAKLNKHDNSLRVFDKGMKLAKYLHYSEARDTEIKKIKSEIHKVKMAKICQTILNLGTMYARLQMGEIAEVCGEDEELIISTVIDMINKNEIHAKYFTSTKSVVFNLNANIAEIDELMEVYNKWELEEVGKI